MYHCHILYHEDKGMMGQYVVAEEGQSPTAHHHNGATASDQAPGLTRPVS